MFTARQDWGDGLDLRQLGFGGAPVASRLYFAVRDTRWRTVPLTIGERRRGASPTGFWLEADAVSAWSSHPLEVTLRYVADGPELAASFRATAAGPFDYCRIGFCVLFPMQSFRGRPATSWREGTATALEFPGRIVTREGDDDPATDRFHRRFDALSVPLSSGSTAEYRFEGAEFELEDQRNWTDASYKAYSTSPPHGSPALAERGERFAQGIRIRVEPPPGAAPAPRIVAPDAPAPKLRIGGPVGVVPPIGLFAGRLSPRSYRPAGGFQELNARRPSGARLALHGSIELAVNGAVHAADDDSVLEATATHGDLIRQVRSMYPRLPVRLAPVSFLDIAGDWRDGAGRYVPEPPAGPLSERLLDGYAATWAIASAAHAVPAGPDELRYFDAELPAGSPAGRAVSRLAKLAGGEVLDVRAPEFLAVLAVAIGDAVRLAVANLSPDEARFRLPGGRSVALPGFGSAWYEVTPPGGPHPPAARTSRDTTSG